LLTIVLNNLRCDEDAGFPGWGFEPAAALDSGLNSESLLSFVAGDFFAGGLTITLP
jgi:hypothetical protein